MKNIILFLTVLLICCHVVAQQTTVTGTVTDGGDGSPLIGANVLVKGTSVGTITDISGKYSVNVPAGSKVLVISCIGYKSQEITLTTGQRVLNVVMKEDSELLDEVVVVGYGTMKKSDLSGASVSIGEDKIRGSVITNLDQALQGRAAGVTSVMTSGAPGSSVSIRVRGQATVNAGAEPLYVIDGVIVQGGGTSGASLGLGDKLGNGATSTVSPLSSINPSDILSMEILKDASATAIYGAQGANGVVLITTKRGQAGEAKFSYEGLYGMQRQVTRLDMMNLREFAEFSASVAAETNSLVDRPEFQDPSLLGKGTNWQDAVFRNAAIQQHQISAQGGTDKVKYYVSGSYMNQEGTIIGTDFNRFSFRINLDAQLKSWLKLGLNAMYSKTAENLGLSNGEEGMLTYSLLTPPDIPIYDIDGNYASEVREGYTRVNPIAKALNDELTLDRSKLNGSFFLDVTPVKDLTWHSELGYDISDSRGGWFYPTYKYGTTERSINELSVQRNNSLFWQLKNYLTHSGIIDKHSFSAMIGQEMWESSNEILNGFASGLPSNEVKNLRLGESASYVVGHGFGSSAMASFFGRATYNYDNRYLGTYTYRRDGSSNFGPENRWAGFHAYALSWRFSNEAFLEPLKTVLSNGKLRFGWGQTGNSSIPGYQWGAAISRMPTSLGVGYRQSNIANPYIKWETQEQWNLGLDIGLFDDRISLVIDAYDKTSNDMLMGLQLPSYMGTRGNSSSALSAPMGNYGTINNKGMEITLNTRNLTGAFEWDTDFQISFNKNKLVALDGTSNAHIEGYAQWRGVGSPVTITNIGEPLYNFYGYITEGYYKNLADLQNSPKPAAYPKDGSSFNRYNTSWVGDVKFKDISGPDGKPDGKIDENDMTNIGSPMPKFTYGMTNTFRFKDFDLSVFINGSYGNKVLNYTAINLSNMNGIYNNQLKYVTNRARLEVIDSSKAYDGTDGIWNWYEDITNVKLVNANSSAPRSISGDPNGNTRISDRYVEDGSYLRIKNITLGYTVPTKFIRKYKLETVRVYANIQNLYTFTNYTGFDPEVGVSTMDTNVYGLDYGRYPSPQAYTFGFNLSF
ncbi:TonB-dependent receptor SusC [termite gut metagenome]|uniref:TonB-dependent receptor SusC n=1 Tax=termite gut metagenome TaxID=433724 RepID=A0A5J4S616_9ZZZZ